MTLLETVVALVILALAAIGCLELTQGATNLEYSATQWNDAVTIAESRMAQATIGAPVFQSVAAASTNLTNAARDEQTQVTREAYRAGLDLISVSVPVAGGKRYVLRRLVPSLPVRAASVGQ